MARTTIDDVAAPPAGEKFADEFENQERHRGSVGKTLFYSLLVLGVVSFGGYKGIKHLTHNDGSMESSGRPAKEIVRECAELYPHPVWDVLRKRAGCLVDGAGRQDTDQGKCYLLSEAHTLLAGYSAGLTTYLRTDIARAASTIKEPCT